MLYQLAKLELGERAGFVISWKDEPEYGPKMGNISMNSKELLIPTGVIPGIDSFC